MPSLVGTTADFYATVWPCSHRSFYANGRFWVVYNDSTNEVYRTSTDGLTWTSPTAIRTATASYFNIWFDGTYLHYVYAMSSSLYYRRGTPNSDGTISWSTNEQTISTKYNHTANAMVSVDSDGYVWIGYFDYDGWNYYPFVIKSQYNNGIFGSGTITQLSTISDNTWRVTPIPLTSGKMLVLYAGDSPVKAKRWDGSSWGTEVAATSRIFLNYYYTAVAEGDDVHVVFLTTSPYDIRYVKYTYLSNSFSAETTLKAATTGTSAPVISITPTNDLYVFAATRTTGSPSGWIANHIYYIKYTASSGTWGPWRDWIDESVEQLSNSSRLTCFYKAYDGKIGLAYMTKTASPYNVKFAQIPNWLSGWNYRKCHMINSSSGAGTNYQVKIVAHYGTGTDSGADVYLNRHCRTDFGDVRFTESDGTTLLDYWFQGTGTENYSEYSGNPIQVLSNTGMDYPISVVKDGSYYYKYYTKPYAATGRKIYRAQSSDGKTGWTDNPSTPVLEGKAGTKYNNGVTCANVWKEDSTYKMLFSGVYSGDSVWRTFYATSPDGITWTVQNSDNPVLEPIGGWETNCEPWSVIKVGTTYYLWYNNVASGTNRATGLATSTDLINWTRDSNNPIFTNGRYMTSVVKYGSYYYLFIFNNQTNSLELYKDTSPTFYSSSRTFIQVAHSTVAGSSWEGTVIDAVWVMTDDITKSTFNATNNELWIYYGGYSSSTTNLGHGLLIEPSLNVLDGKKTVAIFWVEVADDLSTNTATIYIYYGNATATTTSNGDNTFIFFDDFLGTSLDSSKWQWNAGKGSITVANSEVRIYSAPSTGVNPAIQALNGIDPLNKKFECKMRFASLPTVRQYGFNARSNGYYFFWLATSPDSYDYYIAGTSSGYWEVVTWATNTNYICRSAHNSSGSKYERDSSSWTTTCTFASGTLLKILLGFYIYGYNDGTSNSVDMYVDWVFVRKWVDPEPAHGSWGSEESFIIQTLIESLGLAYSILEARAAITNELVSLSDIYNRTWTAKKTYTELLTLTGTFEREIQYLRTIVDSLKLVHTVSPFKYILCFETLFLIASRTSSAYFFRTLVECLSSLEAVTKQIGKTVFGLFTSLDAIRKQIDKSIFELFVPSDVTLKQTSTSIVSSLTLEEHRLVQSYKLATEVLSASETVIKRIGQLILAFLTLEEFFISLSYKLVLESLFSLANIQKEERKEMLSSLTLNASLTKTRLLSLTEALQLLEKWTRSFSHKCIESLKLLPTFSRLCSFILSLSASLTLQDKWEIPPIPLIAFARLIWKASYFGYLRWREKYFAKVRRR